MSEGRSAAGKGFLGPRKLEGLAARDTSGTLLLDLGLEAALGSPVGVKEIAAGFGRNSMAFALNFVDTAEVGVGAGLGFCEPTISVVVIAGPVGG